MKQYLDTSEGSGGPIEALLEPDSFQERHIGPRPHEWSAMAQVCGYETLTALVDAAVPMELRRRDSLHLPQPLSEAAALAEIRKLADQNVVRRSLIGMGYYDTLTPAVIQRNILENPGWYTQYTPYQAEISQGRLEGLLNFQTLVADLTGLPMANASLLDEATACAEALTLAHDVAGKAPGTGQDRSVFLIADDVHPQNIEIVRARAQPVGLFVRVVPWEELQAALDETVFGVLVQYPGTWGDVRTAEQWTALAEKAHAFGALLVAATDLLALCHLTPPGEWGADVAVGSAQRFGVPLGFGGPHAGFIATREEFKRQLPGRLVGVSKDSRGRPAYRLSLQTREQHIRREKATSNICTAQALLANMAMAYAVYHGPDGLRRIAARVHHYTALLASGIEQLGFKRLNDTFFDTLTLAVPDAEQVHTAALKSGINLRRIDPSKVGISLDERTDLAEVERLLEILQPAPVRPIDPTGWIPCSGGGTSRKTPFLQYPVFLQHQSETGLQRYLRRLESRDLSLCQSMIPLGSCTMKLNAASEMFPVTWAEFSGIHPFAPRDQVGGYLKLFGQLESWLAAITGFTAVSLQPNAGSQGELAGLMVIRAHHLSRGEPHRTVCLIPTSAHGTNPASAVMAGFQVVPVTCDTAGNIDLNHLRTQIDKNRDRLGALMVTYPSTHGVFETAIREICDLVHAAGGQVYMDGANLNAQVGLMSPGDLGADVCHLNLHKTFCIPHGGGGPGVGPIAVAAHLTDYLPNHPVVDLHIPRSIGPISAAPWGSASILPISWMYIAMMGAAGLTRATEIAVLNANYIAGRLQDYFPVLYRGPGGMVAHECILDLRPFKKVTAEDVAKRLIDYGFHAPTLSWPVTGTLMVEPTESEDRAELDRFVEAMIAIHGEIQAIERGEVDPKNNLLKNAPHTADQVGADLWDRPYSREQAAFPLPYLREFKFWPPVGRVDNVHGDRNLVCSCAGMEAYATS